MVLLKEFLRLNNLQINIDKTQLLHITPRQQLADNKGEKMLLEARDAVGNRIKPRNSAKILGLTINNNLVWIREKIY